MNRKLLVAAIALVSLGGCASPGHMSDSKDLVPVLCSLGDPRIQDGVALPAAYECTQTRGPGLVVLSGCTEANGYTRSDGTSIKRHYRCSQNMSGLHPAGPGLWDADDRMDRELRAAEARAARESALAEIRSRGPVRAYPALAIARYRHCQDLANTFLSVEAVRKDTPGVQGLGMELIKECVNVEEAALNGDVRLALESARPEVLPSLKELHAYTVASLRALTNFNQSAIEARQARSDRMAGIDERAARLELDL